MHVITAAPNSSSAAAGPAAAAERGGWAPGLWRWAATIAATVVSIGVLDAVVAAVGGLFVLWGVLGDVGPVTLAVVLLASYLLWGLGLGANLRANAELLWSTGTSTDACSKAAFELARRRGGGARRCRWAGHVGYLATEVSREVPFFLAAFGAAGMSDRVDQRHATTFLVGSNVGAAACELALALASRAYLARRFSAAALA